MAKDKIRRSVRDSPPSTRLTTLADIWHALAPSRIIRKTGDITLYHGRLAVYELSLNPIFYLIAHQDESELVIVVTSHQSLVRSLLSFCSHCSFTFRGFLPPPSPKSSHSTTNSHRNFNPSVSNSLVRNLWHWEGLCRC